VAREYGEPTPSQLEKINQLARKPLEKEEVFVFSAKLAGDMIIPGRYIQLSKPLLGIFKQDAEDGVSVLLDHSWAGFGRPKPAIAYGRTFDAQLKRSDVDGEEWALYADHYIPRGIEIDGISTDSIIQSVETGTMFDTSIGWGAEKYACSICGGDIRSYKCSHWPGRKYVVNEGEDDEHIELCYAIAKPPGFLMENSLVFDGAYPTAGVLSQMGSDESKGDLVMVNDLKATPQDAPLFHIFSSTKGKLYTFATKDSLEKKVIITKEGGTEMDEKKYTKEEVDALVEKAVEKYAAENKVDKDPPYMTHEQAVEKLGKELHADEVLRFAKEGIDYHAECVEEATKDGVRAMGNDFPAETWKATFATMSTKQINDIASTWHKQAKEEIPAGRQTDPEAGEKASVDLPDEAFKC
jgi:hypothetical protein